jgi:hypothetical protein
MNFEKFMNETWEITVKNIAPLIILSLVFLMVSILTLGILMPVMLAGYTDSILRMIQHNRKPEVGDLFSHLSLFFPLIGLAILIIIAVIIGFALLVLPGIAAVILIAMIYLYFYQFLVTEKKGVISAVSSTWKMITAGSHIGEHIVILILVTIFNSIGASVFLGTIITLPLSTVFLSIVFLNQTGHSSADQGTSAKSDNSGSSSSLDEYFK